jgi:hypothetical protein
VAIIKVAEQVKGTSINPPYSIKKKIRNREDEFFLKKGEKWIFFYPDG